MPYMPGLKIEKLLNDWGKEECIGEEDLNKYSYELPKSLK